MDDGPASPADKTLALLGMAAVLVGALCSVCLPVFVAILAVTWLLPDSLSIDGWGSAIFLSIAVTITTILADLVVALIVRRFPISSIGADLARRMWVFVLTSAAIVACTEVIPGVTRNGLLAIFILSAVSVLADFVSELFSASRQSGAT